MELIKVCVLVAVFAFASADTSTDFFKDFQLGDYVEISRNSHQEVQGRSDSSLEDNVENFIKNHDVTFKLPVVDSTLTFTARNLDSEEVDVKLRFNSGSQVEARKKSKLKKIFVPIFVFLLIKAIVLIPLALGILAIKTWNALQLSFVSFVVALSLGVWQLCKKISGDNAHPQIVAASVAHGPWDPHLARAFDTAEAQKLAYSAYAPDF